MEKRGSSYELNHDLDLHTKTDRKNRNYRRRKRNFKPFLILLLILVVLGVINSVFSCNGNFQVQVNTDNSGGSSQADDDNQINDNNDKKDDLTYYYYSQLDSKSQTTYETILEAMLNMDSKVRIQEKDKTVMAKVMQGIMADHPELFWCDGAYTYTLYEQYTEFTPTYLYNRQEKSSRQTQIETQVKQALNPVQENWSDYEKAKYIYEYVIKSVEYVTDAPDNQNIYSSLINKRSVCAGYTRASQYLLQQLGIECLYVSGMVNGTESHAWNIVKCDGNYYQMDATFGDGAFDTNSQSNIPEELIVNYSYLCCSDIEIYRDHTSDMSYELPSCNMIDLNYYKQQGGYFTYYSDSVLEELEKAIFCGDKTWQCQFSNEQSYRAMMDAIQSGSLTDIVSRYQTSIGYGGSWTAWHMGHDTMYTISCWY